MVTKYVNDSRPYVYDWKRHVAYCMNSRVQAEQWRDRWLPHGDVAIGRFPRYRFVNPAAHTVSELKSLTSGNLMLAECTHCLKRRPVCCATAEHNNMVLNPYCGSCCTSC